MQHFQSVGSLAAATVLGFAGGMLATCWFSPNTVSAQRPPNDIVARSFSLIDDSGIVRANLGMTNTQGVRFLLSDRSGSGRIGLAVGADRSAAHFYILDAARSLRMEIGLDGRDSPVVTLPGLHQALSTSKQYREDQGDKADDASPEAIRYLQDQIDTLRSSLDNLQRRLGR